ncbi:RluA family pseudouridine synthase [Thaumasiovibrio sp. DFM-14]|uniref:RluA family pseudouridine synthase n=1 Tax=Thaumasiovibrio sp. DFM-14 TaxID=3384792 RepID=UPI0039A07BCA
MTKPFCYRENVAAKNQDRFITEHLNALFPFSKHDWSQLILSGHVTLDSQPATTDSQLKTGQQLQVLFEDYAEPKVDTQWRLLWHHGDIAAVYKPATLPVSRTTRNIRDTLISLVQRESDWADAHLLHRLDLETAGIVLIGKSQQAAARWQPHLKSLMQKKIYEAVVYGEPDWQQTEVECQLNTRSNSPIRCQMHVCAANEKGKQSHTRFSVIRRHQGFAVIRCELITGRKHQIRAHLANLGHPIVGDKIYANQGQYYLNRLNDCLSKQDEKQLLSPHHLLLAKEVTLNIDGQAFCITTPHYPKAWQTFCAQS